MKFKLHSNPILKDLANMAVLALKFYIPSQSRTNPVSQTRAAKALQDDVRELLVLLPPFPSQMRSESDIRFTARRCIAREERGLSIRHSTKQNELFLTQFGTELVLSHIVVFSKMSRRIWDAKKRHLPIGLSIAITQIVRAPSLLLACLAGSSSSPPPILPFRLLPQISNEVRKFLPPYFSHLEIWGPGVRVSMALGLFPSFSLLFPSFSLLFPFGLFLTWTLRCSSHNELKGKKKVDFILFFSEFFYIWNLWI